MHPRITTEVEIAEPVAEGAEAESSIHEVGKQPINCRETTQRSSPNEMAKTITIPVNHVAEERLVGDREEAAQAAGLRPRARHREAAEVAATPRTHRATRSGATEDRAREYIIKSDRETKVVTQTIVLTLQVGIVVAGLGQTSTLERRLSANAMQTSISYPKYTVKTNRKLWWRDIEPYNLIVVVFIVEGPKGPVELLFW